MWLVGSGMALAQNGPADAAADNPAPIILLTNASEPRAEPDQLGLCFEVDRILLEGRHDLVSRRDLIAAATPHAVPCQSNETVGALLKALNGLFAERGYVTTQAWLPEQDIAATRTLTLQIVAGRIDQILYEEQREPYVWFVPRMAARTVDVFSPEGPLDFVSRVDRWLNALDDELDRLTLLPPAVRLALARTVNEGDVLHVDRLQDTLDSFNRVRSAKAKADLKPGSRPATSDVVITNRIEDSFRVYAGYDTESIEGEDRLLFGITAEKDNLIGINDRWSVTLKSGVETNELNGSVAVPLGRWTARASGSWSETITVLSPLTELFTTTWTVDGGFDYVAYASKTGRVTVDATLAHREHNRYINGLELTEQRVTWLAVGATWNRYFSSGSLTARLGGSFGLPILSAVNDAPDIGPDAPRSQFVKLEGTLAASYAIAGRASFSSYATGQWSDDPLFSDDQLTIGGRSSVRGWSDAPLKADSNARRHWLKCSPKPTRMCLAMPDGASTTPMTSTVTVLPQASGCAMAAQGFPLILAMHFALPPMTRRLSTRVRAVRFS